MTYRTYRFASRPLAQSPSRLSPLFLRRQHLSLLRKKSLTTLDQEEYMFVV